MSKYKRILRRLALLPAITVMLAILPMSASATPISSPSDIDSPKTVIDFESEVSGTSTPISEGGATINATGDMAVTNYGMQLWSNPPIVSGQYLGFAPGNFYITFTQPVSQFGLGVFDPNYSGNRLIAYDAAQKELESIYLPYSSSETISIFAGFKRAQADIAEIDLIHSPGDYLGIDNITFSRVTTVPLPGAVWLLGSGLLSLAGLRRFRKS